MFIVLKTIQSYMCLKATNKNIVKTETHLIMYMLMGNSGLSCVCLCTYLTRYTVVI